MKTKTRIAFRRVGSTVLLAVALMWLMPGGSYDPVNIGFYMSLFVAVAIDLGTTYLVKKYQVNKEE